MSPLRAWLVALPLAQLPGLPQLPLPVDLGRTVSGVTDELPALPLKELRGLRIRELLRTQRRVLEADPQGAPIVRNELLAFSPSGEALARARAAGYSVVRERVLAGLDARVLVLSAPARVSTRRALKQLRELDPDGTYDFNHVYTESGEAVTAGGGAEPAPSAPRGEAAASGVAVSESRGEAGGVSSVAGPPIRVGLVDGGVDPVHPVFAGVTIHQHGCDGSVVPSAHGTAVASLIAGHAGKFQGAAPGAELYAADIYCGRPAGGAMDDIAEAIAWIVEQRVAVINVSLVGPKNLLLENVVRAASAKGHLIVAAVGNDGPAARPLYPAAYPDVVGVTAVDSHQRVLLEACRGPHVDFAAPGADMSAAVMSQAYSPVRGTSFAAPLVASLLGARLREPGREAAQAAFAGLTTIAADLGDRGVDVVYGNGLVGDALRTDPALARTQ